MTRAFIGGKEVRKEDLGKYEIKSEKVKRILAEKICEAKKKDEQ